MAIVLTSAWIALSEFLPVPDSWDEMIYPRRRAELSDVLGPAPEERAEPTSPSA